MATLNQVTSKDARVYAGAEKTNKDPPQHFHDHDQHNAQPRLK